MTVFILTALLLLSIAVFIWTCKTSIEPFIDMDNPAAKDVAKDAAKDVTKDAAKDVTNVDKNAYQ